LQPSSEESADEGVFVPIAPAPPGFEANRAYDRGQFIEALGSAAASVPEVGRDDTQGGG
jgi:hypothetical protein